MYKLRGLYFFIFSFLLFGSFVNAAGNQNNEPNPFTSTTNASICSGNSYFFNGNSYSIGGLYTVHLTNSLGGDSTAILNLTVNSLPTPVVTSSSSTTFCAGDSINLLASASGTYLWNTGETTPSITVKSSGYYHVYFTDINGCTAFSPETAVYVNPLPTISIGTVSDICAGTTNIILPYSATTGNPDQYSIIWNQSTIDAGMSNVGWTTLEVSPIIINNPSIVAGSYSGILSVKNSVTGCVSSSGTTSLATICSIAGESGNVVLTAPSGGLISEITFASYGTPTGTCGNFSINSKCHAANSVSLAAAKCVGQNSCSFSASNDNFGDPCPYTFKFMYVQANTTNVYSSNSFIFKVKQQTSSTTNATICAGTTYTFNGIDYSLAGTYVVHLTNSDGCDSAATLILTLKNATASKTNASICSGTNYLFNGVNYHTSGTYTVHLINAAGCDSTATLFLTVRNTTTSTTYANICEGSSYNFNGVNYNIAGTYAVYLTNSADCDSIATLVLNVKKLSESNTNASICAGSSYFFNGNNYSIEGTYTIHLLNSVGCDSAATLILSVKYSSTSNTIANICAGSSYFFNGTNFSRAGTYVVHLTNEVGCDSAATLVLTVNPLPFVSAIVGSEGICAGNKALYMDASVGGIWSSSKNLIATVDAIGHVTAISAGIDTISYSITNSCGTVSAIKKIIVGNSKPIVKFITGISSACAGSSSSLSDATDGGIWSSDNLTIASVNETTGIVSAMADGTANITYTVGAALGCSSSVSIPFTVSCTTVTSGGEGGLESKSMGDAVAKRVYNKAIANTNNTVDYSMMPIVKDEGNKVTVMGVETAGTQSVSSLMPSLNAIGVGFTAYDMSESVADLPGITNASIVKAYDYTVNAQTKASALISRTYGLVYQHTKPICDRLKEASLIDIKQVSIQGMHFIQYKLLQNTGQVEYAISFSAGIQQGIDSFRIQSVWLTKNFISQDTMFNFQIWSIDPMMTLNMLKSTLNKLRNQLPLSQVNGDVAIPSTYISKITRNQNKLLLTINNQSTSTNGTLKFLVNANENSLKQETISQPISLLPTAITEVAVDLNDNYESDVHLFVDGVQQDLAYMNDGNWNFSVSNSALQPNSFNIINDGVMPIDSTEFRLLRNVQININVSDYVSIYKMMKAGGLTKDLSGYSNLEFDAVATGASQIKIVIQKSSISNWNSQYSYTLPISRNLNHYQVKLSDFTSNTKTQPLIADDVITVTFSFISDGGNYINASLADAKFTKSKSAIVSVAVDSFGSKSISAFPNPAKDRFVCTFQSNKKAKLKLKIVELSSGRVVGIESINAMIGNNTVPIIVNTSNIKGGAYVLMLEGEEEKYLPFKMLFKE